MASQKTIRDGNVAVLISPGYGAGWSTENRYNDWFTYGDPTFVRLVEEKANVNTLTRYVNYLFDPSGDECVCLDGIGDLKIEWIPVGTHFRILEYDGCEYIDCLDVSMWNVA
jgi:hypothetical protein